MKKKMSLVLLSFMSIVLAACLVLLYLIVGTDIFFKSQDKDKNTLISAENPTIDDIISNVINTGKGELNVKYNGGALFAGGRATSDKFTVELKDEDGNVYNIKNYSCNMLNEDYRLVPGSNTFVFNYGELTSMITLEAVEPSSMGIFAPSYVLYDGDRELAAKKISQIEDGSISYSDALSNVAFTGDSQIAVLVTYGYLTLNTVEALVGASADYLEKNFDTVITKAYGKKALIVHYGINSLSSSEAEREYRISQYRELLLNLKKELPGTRIVVSGVFPVSRAIQYDKAGFAYINSYDYALLNMCMDIDVEYYSNNEYIDSHQELFSPDGLHLKAEFYRDYWLKDIIKTLGV